MKIKAYVIEDKAAEYEFNDKKTDKLIKGQNRQLTCVDLDEGDRIESSFRVSIPVKDSLTGDPAQGASLRDALIDLSIVKIDQWESGQLAFKGRVLKIHKGGLANSAQQPQPPAK